MVVFSALAAAAAIAASPAAAADSRAQAAACVTLDDRPCYSGGGQQPTAAERQATGAAAGRLDLARRYARAQVAKGNCALARSSAEQLGDQALLAEIRQACPGKAQPQAAPAAVKLW